MTNYIVPCLIFAIVVYGAVKKVDVFEAMGYGIGEGLKVCKGIFPAVLTMITVVSMLRASGAIDKLAQVLAPLCDKFGIPSQCLPLALLRPFSGGGALSMGSEIIKQSGPDSLPGRIAAVMMGASETSFYTIAVYSAYLGIKNTRYTTAAAICADGAAFIMSGIAVRLLMG